MEIIRTVFPPILIILIILSYVYYLDATKGRSIIGTILSILLLFLVIAGVIIIFYTKSGIAFDTILGVVYIPEWLKWIVAPGIAIFQFLILLIYPLPLIFLYYGVKGIKVIIKKLSQ